MEKLDETQEMAWHRNQYVRWIMRNIDRLRSMSLEEIAPYLVYRTMINKSEVWYSPSGYTFSNQDAAIENCIHWLDKEYHKEN